VNSTAELQYRSGNNVSQNFPFSASAKVPITHHFSSPPTQGPYGGYPPPQ
jgi:hypothetical protein